MGVGPPRVVARDARRGTGQFRVEAALAAAAFAVLCVAVLKVAPRLVEPDDYAYRGSILAITHRHLLTLSTAQARALAGQLAHVGRGQIVGGPGGPLSMIRFQWVQLPGGPSISEKDPGYPFLAVPFQALGVIRLAPLFYGALGCLGLFAGARRWLGRFGGAAAVGLFCSSGAALLFAWRDYMPTFTDASLIAAGTGRRRGGNVRAGHLVLPQHAEPTKPRPRAGASLQYRAAALPQLSRRRSAGSGRGQRK